MKHHKPLPLPGQRIIRSVISVWLCFGVYLLRGKEGLPIFSAIAVLQSMPPYTKEMWSLVKEKTFGTVIGAVWGLILISLELVLVGDGAPNEAVHYLLIGLFAGITIYSTVLLKLTYMAPMSAVVFLSIAVNYIQGIDPYLYSLNRFLDTVIGLCIAEFVNRIQLPRSHNTDILFVSTIGHTILGDDRRLSAYSLVELNRLIEDGAKFTVSTKDSQATVREQLQGVNLPYPIITLDGAALYHIPRMEYLRTVPMMPERAERIMRWTRQHDLEFFCNIIQDNLLIIRYRELSNAAMQDLFERNRPSPYRNYVKTPVDYYNDVIYLMIMDRTEKIDVAYDALLQQPWSKEYRIVKDTYHTGGYSFLKIYDASVSREAMLRELEQMMGTKKTITFGSEREACDVYIENADRDTVVKELRRRYEPVDLRYWKTIFRA